MADLLICAADIKVGTIETVRSALGTNVWQNAYRQTVVDYIRMGHTAWTYIQSQQGGHRKGAQVTLTGNGFVTTRPNNTTSDNLDSLPSLTQAPFVAGSAGR